MNKEESPWISPDKKPEKLCIAQYKKENGYTKTVMAQYVKARTIEYMGDCGEWADYEEENDIYWCQEGWYEQGHDEDEYGLLFIDDEVFRWMHIPK